MSKSIIVYCHLCILKERCEFATPKESYEYYHWDGFGDYPLSLKQDEKMMLAFLNCPIRKLVEEKEAK